MIHVCTTRRKTGYKYTSTYTWQRVREEYIFENIFMTEVSCACNIAPDFTSYPILKILLEQLFSRGFSHVVYNMRV